MCVHEYINIHKSTSLWRQLGARSRDRAAAHEANAREIPAV